MNIINLEHINKIYGEKVIFEDASFGIQERDKIGIVGINGTGKSTLLKVIAGEEVPDSGQVIRQNGLKLAFVPQNPVFPDGAEVLDICFSSSSSTSSISLPLRMSSLNFSISCLIYGHSLMTRIFVAENRSRASSS